MGTEDRTRVADAPRTATGREWEVFVRETNDGPLKHVGSVTAADADAAHEHAGRLFGWAARDVWLCPADETRRYTTHALVEDEAAEDARGDGAADGASGGESA
ncbi:Htur_1727 family rSAM-partnered candidate RiPP [Halobacterium yunchengense]|uniref:Htur_1727 family rSAM-partnered candidate RiPP n=1 Tax=Halobacterium yunchengense TaxID=3108497 RepID=UPI003008E13B